MLQQIRKKVRRRIFHEKSLGYISNVKMNGKHWKGGVTFLCIPFVVTSIYGLNPRNIASNRYCFFLFALSATSYVCTHSKYETIQNFFLLSNLVNNMHAIFEPQFAHFETLCVHTSFQTISKFYNFTIFTLKEDSFTQI